MGRTGMTVGLESHSMSTPRQTSPRKPLPPPSPALPRRRRTAWLVLAGLVLLVSLILFIDWWTCLPDDAVATYVGRQSCAECHAQEVEVDRLLPRPGHGSGDARYGAGGLQ